MLPCDLQLPFEVTGDREPIEVSAEIMAAYPGAGADGPSYLAGS